LIQIFRSLFGTKDFNTEKFLEENKVTDISEETLPDGREVYRMVAKPKRGSEAWQKWASQSENEMIDWQQELWVEKNGMQPVKAVLLSDKESTSVLMTNAKVNEPVNENLFQIELNNGQMPTKVRRSQQEKSETIEASPVPPSKMEGKNLLDDIPEE